MIPVFLSGAARWLLVLHALCGFALLGASTHVAVAAVQVLRGRRASLRMTQLQPVVIASLIAAAVVFGLLVYPHYRVNVRGLVLDRGEPWASNLFDMKEYAALLAVPLAAALAAMRRHVEPGGVLAVPFAFCALALFALVAFTAVAGLVVTSVKGV